MKPPPLRSTDGKAAANVTDTSKFNLDFILYYAVNENVSGINVSMVTDNERHFSSQCYCKSEYYAVSKSVIVFFSQIS